MVAVGAYNLMVAVFVGQMVSSSAMAAVGVAYPFTLVNTGIATLIGAGSASILSRVKSQNVKIHVIRPEKGLAGRKQTCGYSGTAWLSMDPFAEIYCLSHDIL